MLTLDEIRAAPKVLLHDHLDGGLRPQTVLDLARQSGYPDLPAGHAAGHAADLARRLSADGCRGIDRRPFAATAATVVISRDS